MDKRMKFIDGILPGEKMTELCREFGISRKIGYKFWYRCKDIGLNALTDRSRRPIRYSNQLQIQFAQEILRVKRDKSSWGAPKIRGILNQKYPEVKTPAKSTIHCVLDKHNLAKRRKKRRFKAQGTILTTVYNPNDLWCADYKGEFMLANRQSCYPLTITDFASRFFLTCQGLESAAEKHASSIFEQTFQKYGLPKTIRTDNGVPFSSTCALFGLSNPSV
jgi:putative transposase